MDPTGKDAAGVLTRAEIERREAQWLAPWGMKSGESRGRGHAEPEHPFRTAYQRDRDRIVHCRAFRRLEYKTQVFLNHEGDHYRTRLTHTLEVAQLSRTIARALGLNEDLAEAVALAHDVGHTPFGHSGESALNEMMKDHGGFEHNRHGLRVVDELESRYPDFPGLNLTYEVREAIAKHTTRWDAPERAETGFEDGPPLLEAQVVELADSVAYDNHDLDDGLEAEILREEDLKPVALWAEAAEALRRQAGDLPEKQRQAQIIRRLVNRFVTDLIENSSAQVRARGIRRPDDVRAQDSNVISFSPGLDGLRGEMEKFLHESLYRHYRVTRVCNGARRFVEAIFRELVRHPDELPPEHRRRAETAGVHRAVCDYVAGMTDRYAQEQYVQLFQPYQKL